MAHIHTEPGQIDHTVTAYIVRLDTEEPQLLLHMHKKYGRLMPPGGHVELDETPWAAIAHEIREETGYDIDQLQVMQPMLRIDSLAGVVNHPQPLRVNTHHAAPDHFHTDMAYLFVAQTDPQHAPSEGESNDIRWVSRTGLEALTEGEILMAAKQASLLVFDRFLHEWEPVPVTKYSLNKTPEE